MEGEGIDLACNAFYLFRIPEVGGEKLRVALVEGRYFGRVLGV